MKQNVFKFTQSIIVMMVMMIVATVASAWTGPTGSFPAGNVAAPINTGPVDQTKIGNLGTLKSFIAGDSIGAGGLILGNKGAFGCQGTDCWNANYATTNNDKFRAGTFSSAGQFLKGLVVSTDGNVIARKSPVWIDLQGLTGVAGRNGFSFFASSDNTSGGAGAVLQTNADKFSFWNIAGSDRVGLSAKSIQLTEGAGTGKVLTSDANGNGAWMDGAATPEITFYVRSGGAGLVEASCSNEYPIIISAGGQCESPAQIQEMYITYMGAVNDPGKMRMRCTKADQGSSSGGVVGQARPVCMKASGPSLTWYDVTKATGTPGQTCAQWLAGYPNFTGNGVNVRVIGNDGGVAWSDTNGCAYARTVSGITYCKSGYYSIGASVIISGVSTPLAPTSSCSGVNVTSAGQQVSSSWKTQIQY